MRSFERRHEAGCSGVELCAALSDLRDAVLLDLTEAALADLGEDGPERLVVGNRPGGPRRLRPPRRRPL